MSPEYALKGLFLVKSDVFSFGVVLLEIISGKKNYESNLAISLIGYVSVFTFLYSLISLVILYFITILILRLSQAWRLWVENKVLDLMDQTLREVCNAYQFEKCVNIGLICVQGDPNDRPTMSTIVTMLDSETATIPTPKRPSFFSGTGLSSTTSSLLDQIYLYLRIKINLTISSSIMFLLLQVV
jgi:hypothetical protein